MAERSGGHGELSPYGDGELLRRSIRKLSSGQAGHVRVVAYNGMITSSGGLEGYLETVKPHLYKKTVKQRSPRPKRRPKKLG